MAKRRCQTCGHGYRYGRRNLVETWIERNPGHRDGWKKEIVKQCLICQPIKMSLAVLRIQRVVPVRRLRRSA